MFPSRIFPLWCGILVVTAAVAFCQEQQAKQPDTPDRNHAKQGAVLTPGDTENIFG